MTNPIPGEDRRWPEAVSHLPWTFFDANFAALQAAFYEAEAEIASAISQPNDSIF